MDELAQLAKKLNRLNLLTLKKNNLCLQIDALPEVVAAVNGRCEVYMDGGIRTGTDIFKAIALGAKAVFVGRPAIYALAYNVSILHVFDIVN